MMQDPYDIELAVDDPLQRGREEEVAEPDLEQKLLLAAESEFREAPARRGEPLS